MHKLRQITRTRRERGVGGTVRKYLTLYHPDRNVPHVHGRFIIMTEQPILASIFGTAPSATINKAKEKMRDGKTATRNNRHFPRPGAVGYVCFQHDACPSSVGRGHARRFQSFPRSRMTMKHARNRSGTQCISPVSLSSSFARKESSSRYCDVFRESRRYRLNKQKKTRFTRERERTEKRSKRGYQ